MNIKNIIIILSLFFLFSTTVSATITYDAGNNTITVTGYTEGTPCTFTDIYNADQSGGWGKVSKQGTNQFLLQCLLYVGDGSTATYLTTIEEQITFETSGCGSGANIIKVRNNAVFTSGVLISESKRQGKQGSSITVRITDSGDTSPMLYIESTGTAYLYATHVVCINTAGVGASTTFWITNFNSNCRLYQVIFTDCRSMIHCTGADTQNLLWVGNNFALEDSYFSSDSAYIWAFGGGVNIYSPPRENQGKPPITNFYAEQISSWGQSATYIGGLRNYLGSLPLPTPTWPNPTLGSQIKWYADIDLEITDINGTDIVGATVTVKNKNDTEQFSTDTDASGKVSETVFVVKDEWSGSGTSNARTDYNGFTITVEKSGYQTYKNTFTFYKKVSWSIALQKSCDICLSLICPSLPSQQSLFPNLDIIDQKCKTMPIPIYTGFNYISIPLYQYNTSLYTLFGNHPVTNDTIKKYVNGEWSISTYNNGTWSNVSNIDPIEPFCGYEYDRAGDNFTLNISGYIKSNIITFDEKTYVGTNIIRPMRSDKDD